jgi:hypothetical protein
MNRLSREKQTHVVASLAEGNSINATVRMTGVSKVTILKVIADLGSRCADYQDRNLRNLKCKRIQCDEIWAFCYAKEKNVPAEKKGQFGFGDVWTWAGWRRPFTSGPRPSHIFHSGPPRVIFL